ncbi:MAG: PAS domain S-box protein [Candidatus Lokiarchaeota archaeon]|nr:PAS domain S-box protein [Candidatus Lokiarchaeota archaeon]
MVIQVLLVDDDSDFLELTKTNLEKISSDLEITTCTTVDIGLELVHSQYFDCVVSDFQMPEKDGLEFLQELREKDIKIPFIIFTGRSREEVAIKALNLGASQYLTKGADIKSQFHQLEHSIKQLVQHKRTEEKYAKREEELHEFLNNTHIGIEIIAEESSTILYANHGMEIITGYSPSELIELTFEEQIKIIHPEDREFLRKTILQRTKGEKSPPYYEIRLIRKNEETIWVAITTIPIQYKGKSAIQVVFLDISQQTSGQVTRTKTKDRVILEKIKTGLYIYELRDDDQLVLIDGNNAAGDITGIYPSEFLDEEFREIWPETEEVGFYQAMINVVKTHEPYESESYDYQDNRVQGCYRIFAFYIPPKILCVSFTDVTDLKQIQEELEKNERILEALFKITKHLNETCFSFTERMENVIEKITKSLPEYMNPSLEITIDSQKWGNSTEAMECIQQYPIKIFEKVRGNMSLHIPRKIVSEVSLSEEDDSMLKTIVEQIGQTLAKQETRAALAEGERKYRTVVQSMADLVLVFDSENRHLEYFPTDSELILTEPEEFLGKTISEVLPEEIAKEYETRVKQAREGRKNIDFEYYSINRRGKGRWFHALFTKHEIEGQVLVVVREISERKKQEQLVKKQKTELSKFAHRMRHDIVGVLSNIYGFLELIRNGEIEHIDSIERLVGRSEKILEKSIILADAGLIIGEKEEVDFETLIKDIASEVVPKTIHVEVECIPHVYGDQEKLAQVTINILRNAVTHGEPSRIFIFQEIVDGRHVIRFCNDGKEIPPQEIIRIKEFETASKLHGIGLTIVQRIIEAHRWQITISSSEDTCFSIWIPNQDIVT